MAANKDIYIVDASVMLKWFLFENEDQTQALMLRHDYFDRNVELHIPYYAFAEVLNIMIRNLPEDQAMSAFSLLLTYKLQEYRIDLELASLSAKLMKKYKGTAFYDAGYHALALQTGGTFITADEKYYKKTKKAGHVMLLKNYGKRR